MVGGHNYLDGILARDKNLNVAKASTLLRIAEVQVSM